MANRNTKRNRPYKGYKVRARVAINSSKSRQDSGKARYKAPTITDRSQTAVHPVSGLTNRQMAHMIP